MTGSTTTTKSPERLLVKVEGLKTYFHTEDETVRAVDGVDLEIYRGETLGVVGESGSGKSVTAYSILRLIPEGQGEIVDGKILWYGEGGDPIDLTKLPIESMPDFRGDEVAMIFQEPMTSLNPVFKCGWQVAESIRQHKGVDKEAAWKRATELLDEVGIPMPERRMNQFPHELSGGMKQRVMIAMALACDPKLLICDEPTTALDVTIQKQILQLIERLQKERDMAVLFITHDLGVIAEITDTVAVVCPGETLRTFYKGTEMEHTTDYGRGGQIVEFGNVQSIFKNPQHPYTKGLVRCRPTLESRSERLPTIDDFLRAEKQGITLDARDPNLNIEYPGKAETRREDKPGFGDTLLELENVRTWFPIHAGVFQRVVDHTKAVDDVSLTITRGMTLGLVGESGCGKTTLGRTILRLEEPQAGSRMRYEGRELTEMSFHEMREMRRKMQIIFQDPYSSLNPRLSIVEALTEPMKLHGLHGDADGRRQEAGRLLERVGLKRSHLDRYPHEFSGGQRQRICVARTLAVEPEFVICDEAVSALDVSIQAGVINLLLDLQDEMGLTYIFISHDLGVVKYVSDVVAVMCPDRTMADLFEGEERKRLLERNRGGHIVEMKEAEALYENPEHPYTRKLLAAIPKGEVRE